MQQLAFYYLRTPLISFSQLLDLLDRGDLVTFVQQPVVGEAIFLASPTLYEQIQSDPQLRNDKLRQTVLKYVLRMGSRSTPFGLFAGCWLGHVGPVTSLEVLDRQVNCHYRLSAPILGELLNYLNTNSSLRHSLRYQVNTSLYPVGKVYRYLEVDASDSPARFFTSQLQGNPALRCVLRLARQSTPFQTYVKELTQLGYEACESQAFVDQLIADQVLVSELSLNVTGADALDRLNEVLQHLPEGKTIWASLNQLSSLLAQRACLKTKNAAIRTLFQEQFGLVLPPIPLLQGDTLFTGQGHQLSASLLRGLQKSLQNLFCLYAALRPAEALVSFKKAFYARYGDQEIPLSVALDAESGIGYGNQPVAGDTPIMETLMAASLLGLNQQESTPLNPAWDKWLLKRYESWQTQSKPVLELTNADLTGWSDSPISIPESYYVLGYFLAASSKDLDTGRYKFRSKVMAGPSAFSLLGRFCRADKELNKQVQGAYQQLQKQNTDRIYAEIVHLPSIAVGNVVQRPHLSEYEIPYLGLSTLPPEKQIPITDLWVSVPNGERVILRSRRLNKQIVPRLTTAHNYLSGLPTYRFLCDLQQQESPLMVQWPWGSLSTFRYLPRVEYRQIILQEARWRLDQADIDNSITDAENVARWRQLWQWPRFVALIQADQELFLDMDNSDCQKLLVSTLRRLTPLYVFEWLQTPDQCCVHGPQGPLTHEVILPFVQRRSSLASPPVKISNLSIERTFIPGSDWLFLKVYGGPQVCKQLLIKLGKLARSSIRAGTISHWFFIRYEDPEPHLRFRFHLTDKNNYTSLLSACQRQLQVWINTGEIHRVQLDTYQRELERYGVERIENTEWIFWTDSDAVLTIRQNEDAEQALLGAALLGTDRYLTDFGLNLVDKSTFCLKGFQALFNQEGAQSSLKKQLANLYRQNQSILIKLMTKAESPSLTDELHHLIFYNRSHRAKPFMLSPIFTNDQLQPYIASLIHLFINRLFDQHQRSYEVLVYHHLARFYKSQLAQNK
ncbi:lantibiotic dehydratase [Spirosoma linguale]|uniref:Lantibiotic dehydratase domain protein n=1 Tax=Spirosoma linguale (strain ATCC 33905 / DSM 74 / LMG 10896 / Claus 1) TaxID=504472 RepID=D2QDN1_SPILD|nr:Lantibiotic dehydratase domain protein [Spirosoma linguale DSM 74]